MGLLSPHPALGNFLLGNDPKQRKAVTTILSTAYFYLVCSLVAIHAAVLGLVPTVNSVVQVLAMSLSWLIFFVLARSGWSLRLKDPSLSLPHALVGVCLNCLAYVAYSSSHGNVLLLLSLSLVLTMLQLPPRQIIAVSLFTILVFSVTMAVMPTIDPLNYSRARELAYFGLIMAGLPAMAWVAKSVSEMRLALSQKRKALRATLAQVHELATHDQLTGLINRGLMQELLEQERKRSQRNGIPYCVALLDIDFFKIINDAHGHRTGDLVLKNFAAEVLKHLRQIDVVARWGGEEFVVLFPQTRLDDAIQGLERMRHLVTRVALAPEESDLRVTFSSGVAQWSNGEAIERTLERADHALYAAKHKGRNCVVAAGPVALTSLASAGAMKPQAV